MLINIRRQSETHQLCSNVATLKKFTSTVVINVSINHSINQPSIILYGPFCIMPLVYCVSWYMDRSFFYYICRNCHSAVVFGIQHSGSKSFSRRLIIAAAAQLKPWHVQIGVHQYIQYNWHWYSTSSYFLFVHVVYVIIRENHDRQLTVTVCKVHASIIMVFQLRNIG